MTTIRRLPFLLAAAAALAAAAVFLSPGTAAAAGTVNCAPYGPASAADVQAAAASGGTVTIYGVCHGTVQLTTSVTLRGGTSGATSGLDGSGAGPVIEVGGGTVTLGNLLVTGGNCLCQGAGVSADGATLYVNGSRVLNNTATSFGGGIYAENSSAVYVSSSTISGNSGRYDGGGLMMNSGSNLTLARSTVSGNSVDQGAGGGISQFGAQLTLNTSTISGNHADGGGGGIAADFATTAISRTTITNNTASFDGGGILSSDANYSGGGGLSIANSSIEHNSAESEGGGLLNLSFYGDSRVNATNTTFAFNSAPFGGAVHNSGQGATASFSGSALTFIGNKALSGLGGAIYNEAIYSVSHGLVTLSQSRVGPALGTTNANRAQRGGGIYNFVYPGLGGDAHVTLAKGTTVSHNVALDTGGGVDTCAAGVLTLATGGRVVQNTPNNVHTEACN
jgi:predicted outer membrane repeat protein